MPDVSQPVYVVRHGQSVWNLAGLTQGQTRHPELTDRGRAQAAAAAQRLSGLLTDRAAEVRLHTSDLARAAETSRIIADVLRCAVQPDRRLRERHFGCRQGRRHRMTTRLLRLPGADRALSVEPARAVVARAQALLDELDPSVPHVLVTHGEVIRLLTDSAPSQVVANGAVLTLRPRKREPGHLKPG
jgi:2,3-bisphosphoglycerate-dependent phosphoglycerate mutase